MFILASASPRRRELLQQIGASFDVKVSNAEEIGNNELSADELVKWNALAKAKAVAAENPNIPVLGADTVVALNGEIFGKPGNDDNARKMLRRLAGRTHQVWTGIAWVSRGETYIQKDLLSDMMYVSGILVTLTKKERELLDLIAEHLPNEIIAERLGLSKRSVENYVSRIFDKFNVKNRYELGRYL